MTPENRKRLAAALKVFRARAGLSQSDLAEILAVPVDTVQNWEQVRTAPAGMARAVLLRFLMAQLPHGLTLATEPSE